MQIEVGAFGSLRTYLPGGEEGKTYPLQAAKDATPRQVALSLGIPLEQIQVVMCNHLPRSLDDRLADGDRLVFIPLLDGG